MDDVSVIAERWRTNEVNLAIARILYFGEGFQAIAHGRGLRRSPAASLAQETVLRDWKEVRVHRTDSITERSPAT